MGQCCSSYDFQDSEKDITKKPKKDDTPVYHIRRISKGKHIILPHT